MVTISSSKDNSENFEENYFLLAPPSNNPACHLLLTGFSLRMICSSPDSHSVYSLVLKMEAIYIPSKCW
jgi:hypothetical protein